MHAPTHDMPTSCHRQEGPFARYCIPSLTAYATHTDTVGVAGSNPASRTILNISNFHTLSTLYKGKFLDFPLRKTL